MYISVYNLFYTSLPVLALGVFEQDVSDKDSIEYPKLYTPGLTNSLFNIKEFMRSVMHGLFSSMVTFLIPYGTYRDGIGPDGYTLSDHMTLASVMAAILILDNTAQVCSLQAHLHPPNQFAKKKKKNTNLFHSNVSDCSRYNVLDDF